MKGVIYLIVNVEHIRKGIKPFLYIGSKKDINEWNKNKYYGSSKLLKEDVKRLGKSSFHREILYIVNYEDYRDLIVEEIAVLNRFDVLNNDAFYNLTTQMTGVYKENRKEYLKQLSKRIRHIHNNRSVEERNAINEKISTTLKQNTDNTIHLKQVVKKREQALTPQDKTNRKERMKEVQILAQSPEARKKALDTYFKKTAIERNAINEKRTNAMHNEKSRQKAVATRLNKTIQEKKIIAEKRKATLAQKSQDEIDAMRQKMGSKGLNHPRTRRIKTPYGVFDAVFIAVEQLEISRSTILRKLKSEKYPEWFYLS